MAKYGMSNLNAGTQQAMSSSYKTLWDLTALTGATTLRRAWIYDVTFGTDGTPADTAMVYKIDRQATTGTRTTAVPAPLDAADAAALITAGVNTTIEASPTAATQLLEIAANQRATYRWVAAPGGELVVPGVTTTGLGGRAKCMVGGYTGTAVSTVHFWE